MRTLKHQLDYVLARNISQSDIRKSRAVWYIKFDSDHRSVLLSFKLESNLMLQFHKRNREALLQPKIDVSIDVGVLTGRRLYDADSFTKCIQDATKETLLGPKKKFAFVSRETRFTYNSVCAAHNTGDFNHEKHLRKKLGRQLQQNCKYQCLSRAKESG
ncbi:hypothetical protein RB195_019584 [Necator americanus]|uniref:Uncharacterized protein n=1 Tax=Necator americanus TaxID=51031 RepID=A0ABR1CFQ4_NECAM